MLGAGQEPAWPRVTLLSAKTVELGGDLGVALRQGTARLGQEPFTAAWLLADVSFEMDRIFTNYSGDASGRFLELAALTSPPGKMLPPALEAVLTAVPRHQRPDGHFGVAVDLAQPLPKAAAPIPMLWGNARLLVGLVTAFGEYRDPKLLEAARRLGDFYVDSSTQLCNPAREAELRGSGTYGDGYTCCYFPAIESLALLHRATGERRYLEQAKRMASFFQKFDALPIEHSHGNLCAWRGILELYGITGEPAWLARARAKWEAAVRGGYVWALGGIGEHWNVWFEGDEGCSESDWLRFNLDLWRFTGETRYLDMAERLLRNQYPANQCANGGYGMRHFDGDASGPVATRGGVDEWPFCCSFHGPLGLHHLKSYLAAGSDSSLYLNFPLDFSAEVQAAGRAWRLETRTLPPPRPGTRAVEIALAPVGGGGARTSLRVRLPAWASSAEVTAGGGAQLAAPLDKGYLRLDREFRPDEKVAVTFQAGLRAEGRSFKQATLPAGQAARLLDVSLIAGPDVLFATPAPGTNRLTLFAVVDAAGRLGLPAGPEGGYLTIALANPNVPAAEAAGLLETAPLVALRPWSALKTQDRAAFAHHLVVAPAEAVPEAARVRFQRRAREAGWFPERHAAGSGGGATPEREL